MNIFVQPFLIPKVVVGWSFTFAGEMHRKEGTCSCSWEETKAYRDRWVFGALLWQPQIWRWYF